MNRKQFLENIYKSNLGISIEKDFSTGKERVKIDGDFESFIEVINRPIISNGVAICSACEQKIVEYGHCINKTLVAGLHKIYQYEEPIALKSLGLNNNQFANFQKLKYFGLVYKVKGKSEWGITELGKSFIIGTAKIPKKVITKNNVLKSKSDELVYIDQVKKCIEYKVEWKEQASQETLF